MILPCIIVPLHLGQIFDSAINASDRFIPGRQAKRACIRLRRVPSALRWMLMPWEKSNAPVDHRGARPPRNDSFF
jgi:hypothetical protein